MKDFNSYQREYRKRTSNKNTRKYEKTISGFLMRTYRNMQSRVLGIQKSKAYLYENKELLPRETFYKWSRENSDFIKLFKDWESSQYSRKLTPSIDRIDSSLGYEVNNMQWITHSENSRKASIFRHHGV